MLQAVKHSREPSLPCTVLWALALEAQVQVTTAPAVGHQWQQKNGYPKQGDVITSQWQLLSLAKRTPLSGDQGTV